MWIGPECELVKTKPLGNVKTSFYAVASNLKKSLEFIQLGVSYQPRIKNVNTKNTHSMTLFERDDWDKKCRTFWL